MKSNYVPPTAKFIINEIISPIVMVVNKIFRLMDGEHDVHAYSPNAGMFTIYVL